MHKYQSAAVKKHAWKFCSLEHSMKFSSHEVWAAALQSTSCSPISQRNSVCLTSIFFQNNCWNPFCSLIEHSWMLPNNLDKICISTLPQHSRWMSLEVVFNLLTWLESCQVRPAVKIWPQVTNEGSISGAPTLQWSSGHCWYFSN